MKKDNWIMKIFILTFVLSILFGTFTTFLSGMHTILLVIILMLVIFVGIIFDMIGVSVLTSKESVFHAKASRKIPGAKETITLLRNSAQVSSICNDVVGDICGILSGALGSVLAITLSTILQIHFAIVSIFVAALISMFTVGGKAVGKNIAVKKCDEIVSIVGKVKKMFKIK